VHVSELSWKHIDHPSEVVEVGQEVTVEVLDVDLDRERVSLSLKATQEDPWQQFARTHAIAQVVPGKVTKLVPFGAFVRVDEGIEGLVHISELAERHVEIPEQVVNVGDELLVKVIDIDLERRRISLSLKQANEGGVQGEATFDPAQYGMAASYDAQGEYIYPEGFDPATGEWLPGYEERRDAWEKQYADAQKRFEAHQEQIKRMAAADAEAALPTSYTSVGGDTEEEAPEGAPAAPRPAPATSGGTLASTRPCRPCARSSRAAAPEHPARSEARHRSTGAGPRRVTTGGPHVPTILPPRSATTRPIASDHADRGAHRRHRLGQVAVSRLLRSYGAVVVDADLIAREVVDVGTPASPPSSRRSARGAASRTAAWTGPRWDAWCSPTPRRSRP
jgi:predicted RNA-binding protein with RPS1 domain